MPIDPLGEVLASVRSRLQHELDAQLRALAQQYEQTQADAVAQARRQVEAEADERWSALLNAARAETQQQVEAAVTAARAEFERDRDAALARATGEFEQRLNAEVERVRAQEAERLRAEFDRQATEIAARSRRDAEQALATERQLGQARLDAERRNAADQLDLLRQEFDRTRQELDQTRDEFDQARQELDQTRSRFEQARRELEGVDRTRQDLEQTRQELDRTRDELNRTRQDLEQTREELVRAREELGRTRHELETARQEVESARVVERPAAATGIPLADDLRRLDEATSISDTLGALLRSAAARTERAALFVTNGPDLEEWRVDGVPSLGGEQHEAATSALLEQALQSGAPVRGSDGAFASPLLLDHRPVAVLYGAATNGRSPDDWMPTLEVLARHGASHLAYLTAMRTAQARQWLSGHDARHAPTPAAPPEDEEGAARRYARLLVSEIKLYNDGAVRAGQQHRDLLQRLGPEIERARRAYEERVPAHVAGRAQHFHNELVQTLAGGDPSLLN